MKMSGKALRSIANFALGALPVLALAVGAFAPAPAAATQDPVLGYWETENKRAIVRIESCGAGVCGYLAWVAEPRDAAGALKLDEKNPDAGLRARTVCGLQFIGGFASERAGVWKDGYVYSPRDGDTYSAELKAVSRDKLKLRGYVGISLLGKSQTWTRVADDRGGC